MIETIPVHIYAGNALIYLSNHYGEPLSVIRECVQNSIDKKAKNIFVTIDCTRRTIGIWDDGEGAGKEELVEKFAKICKSLKSDNELGQKGIGNLAGIAIAQEWHLTTKDTKKKDDPFRYYSLSKARVANKEEVSIEVEIKQEQVLSSRCGFNPSAFVNLRTVNTDALLRLNDLDNLARTLIDAFHQPLKSKKISIRINYVDNKGKHTTKQVEPAQFRGIPVDTEVVETTFGNVVFELFCSYYPLDNSRILIHNHEYSIPFQNLFFRKQLDPKLERIWQKGYFEGSIKLPFCTINAQRDAFEWNEQFSAFVKAVEEYTSDVLEHIVSRIEDATKSERYEKITEQVTRKISELFRKHPNLKPDALKELEGAVFKESSQSTNIKLKPTEKVQKIVKKVADERTERKERKLQDKSKKPEKIANILSDEKKEETKKNRLCEIVLPRSDDRLDWHSRITDENVIQINALHNDFTRAESLGMTKLTEYVGILVEKELTCMVLNPITAKAFSEQFENIFLAYWRANLVKVI